jgi:UDP-glucose 4-epimerase
MNMLIIGGDSFIARNFYKYAHDNHQLTLVSRIATGCANEYVLQDFFSIPDKLFKGQDVLINFAAIVHKSDTVPEALYKRINFELPINFANRALLFNIKHFIQMSTIAVYGDSQIIDEDTASNPNDLYGKYKMLADRELLYLKKNNFTVTCIRPSMVYGGGTDAPGNMRKLISLVNTGLLLPTKGLRNQRHFLNINRLNMIINHIVINKIGGIIIVADTQSYSTTDLISSINKVNARKDRQFYFPIFWKIIRIINNKFYNKLCGNLIIKSTLNLKSEDKVYSLMNGLYEMIVRK